MAATYGLARGFRLIDGRFTSLRSVADEDVSTYNGTGVVAALLSLPVEQTRGSATPARTELLRQLSRDARIPPVVGEHFLGLGGITDAVWEVLRPLVHTVQGPHSDTRRCWEVTLANVSGHRFELPVSYDAGEHQHPNQPPLSELAEILAGLAGRGWHLGAGERISWGAPRPGDPEANEIAPCPIRIELFRRRVRRGADPGVEQPRSRG